MVDAVAVPTCVLYAIAVSLGLCVLVCCFGLCRYEATEIEIEIEIEVEPPLIVCHPTPTPLAPHSVQRLPSTPLPLPRTLALARARAHTLRREGEIEFTPIV